MLSLYGGRRKGQISEHRASLVRGKSTDGLSTQNHLCSASAQYWYWCWYWYIYWYWYWYLEHDEILILVFNVSEFFQRAHSEQSQRTLGEHFVERTFVRRITGGTDVIAALGTTG